MKTRTEVIARTEARSRSRRIAANVKANKDNLPTCDAWAKMNIDPTEGGPNLNLAMCEDAQGKFHYATTPREVGRNLKQEQLPLKQSWESWDDFDEHTTDQQATDLHLEIFKVPRPQKCSKVYCTVAIWKYWFLVGKSHIVAKQKTEAKAKAASKTLSRAYVYLAKQVELGTPQARACLKIIEDSCKDGQVTESVLKDAIIKRAAELKTRQDPWRIFQYYRPSLIAAGYIRHD